MSYFTRQSRSFPAPGLRHSIILTVALGAAATACAGSDESAETPTTSTTSAAATPIALLGPSEFDNALAEEPDRTLINVHIPYEDHIAETDAFIPFDSILDSPDLPSDRSAPIALYCRSGNMSAQASADLAEAGYTDIIDLDGGMNAWEADERSLVNDPSADD